MSLLSAVIQEADKTNTEDVTISRSELLPRIIDLSERIMVFSWGLHNFYIDVYSTSDTSRSLEQMNYENRKYRVKTDLEELQEDIDAFRKKFGDNIEEINNACKKLDAAIHSLTESYTLVDGMFILKSTARDLKRLKYVDVIVELKALHKRMDKVESQGTLATAMRSFRGLSESQLAVSQGQLSVEFSNLFRWNFNRGVNTLTYSLIVQTKDPLLLETVLRALYIADQMVIDIQPYSHFFVTVLVPNIIRSNCEIYTEDNLGALVFNVKINTDDTERPTIPTIFNNLTAAFEFLDTTLGAKLYPDKKFFDNFGDCNRDEFFTKIIDDCIKLNLPSCEDSYQAYKDIVLELETFNKFLVDIHYVNAEKSPLKKYIDHTDLLMYDNKCKKMLTEVRELTKKFLSHSIVSVGSVPDASDPTILDVTNMEFKYDLNTPLFFPKCVISENVEKITSLIAKYLEESVKLPLVYGHQLIPYIKDISVMYNGMVTQGNAVRLKSHPLEIALFFNNTQYLAHCLVGPPWKNILPQPIADQLHTSTINHVHDLRVSGIEKLSVFLRRNKLAILSKIGGVSRHWHQHAFDAFNNNVNHVLGLLRELRDTWCGLLPGRMYQHAMSMLVEALAEAMVKRSLHYVDEISEDVMCLIASRFQYTIDEIQELYPDMFKLEPKIKSFEKFLLIPKLFTCQIMEVAKMWDEKIVKDNYSSDEIRLIIKMRFPSSDFRLKILRGIHSPTSWHWP